MSREQYGALYGLPAIPNIFASLIGGALVDFMGSGRYVRRRVHTCMCIHVCLRPFVVASTESIAESFRAPLPYPQYRPLRPPAGAGGRARLAAHLAVGPARALRAAGGRPADDGRRQGLAHHRAEGKEGIGLVVGLGRSDERYPCHLTTTHNPIPQQHNNPRRSSSRARRTPRRCPSTSP